ncbi:hypothetical protein [Endozoicomonas arenosclerae]|uniref:hypothetical protein n=1 Tax=Endozoicomonas arenosclerae TaxID=1633495 RepID=UPI000781695E|nr:hypothetical protein [Endozoicomonas arenosclerae]
MYRNVDRDLRTPASLAKATCGEIGCYIEEVRRKLAEEVTKENLIGTLSNFKAEVQFGIDHLSVIQCWLEKIGKPHRTEATGALSFLNDISDRAYHIKNINPLEALALYIELREWKERMRDLLFSLENKLNR